VVGNENCEYVNQAGWNKNCYLTFEADYDEHCLYCGHITNSRYCCDSFSMAKSELCFECVNCENCYDCRFCQNSTNCSESWFLKNCIGCSNCFGCINLRNKQYYFLNKKYSKEEYFAKLEKLNLNKYSGLRDMRNKFDKFFKEHFQKYMQGVQNEDSTGDYLSNTQRCEECFDVRNAQDSKFLYEVRNVKNSYDITDFGAEKGIEFCYEVHETGEGVQNICFADQVWEGCHDIFYSKMCTQNSHDLFGCVGLKHAQYCIFNKQYSKEEYFELRKKIIEHMKSMGEFGEFFPITMSPFAYNETLAQDYMSLSKEEVLARGWSWKDEDEGSK